MSADRTPTVKEVLAHLKAEKLEAGYRGAMKMVRMFDAALALAREGAEARERTPDGASMIAAERRRQIDAEGWTPEHDDDHQDAELAAAALAYLDGAVLPRHNTGTAHSHPPDYWPWAGSWWKPKGPIRDLVRAGALLAAEIDRLLRASPEPQEEPAEPSGWRPIESAPKDGTRIILGWPNLVGEGLWDGAMWATSVAYIPHPTYWMPLPPAPEPQEEA